MAELCSAMRNEPQPRDLKLGELAKRQHGVVSIRQLKALGFSPRGVSDAAARTLLDMAALVKPHWLQRMLERAEELELFELGPVESVIARNRGHRGSSRLRRAIVNYKPPAFTRSDAEKLLLGLLADAGLPRPATGAGPLRDGDLALAGIETRRITGRRLEREPEQVVERLGALLERAEARSTAARPRRASMP